MTGKHILEMMDKGHTLHGSPFGFFLINPLDSRCTNVHSGAAKSLAKKKLIIASDRTGLATAFTRTNHPNQNQNTHTMTTLLTFSQAITALKTLKRVTRQGWNGAFIALQPTTAPMTRPYIYIKKTDASISPWTASHSDILSDDWSIVSTTSPTTDDPGTNNTGPIA